MDSPAPHAPSALRPGFLSWTPPHLAALEGGREIDSRSVSSTSGTSGVFGPAQFACRQGRGARDA
eukprot:2665154-Pyramimonas_sp.AAC.1